MAKVRFGNGVSEIRGSIAGNVFSRSGAGAIIRNRITPVNPNTTRQSQARAIFGLVSAVFDEMTMTEAENWKTFADTQKRVNSFGEEYTPTVRQLWMEVGINQVRRDPLFSLSGMIVSGLANLEADPTIPEQGEFELDLTNTAGVLTAIAIDQLATPSANVTHLIVQATPQLQPTIQNAKRYFRDLGVFTSADPTSTLSAYTAVYPVTVNNPVEGLVIHARVKAMNSATGLASSWFYTKEAIPSAV